MAFARLCACLLLSFAMADAWGQVVIHPETPTVKLDLRHVRSIKPSTRADEPSVEIVVTPVTRETRTRTVPLTTSKPEERTREVQVTKMRTETRTRAVPVAKTKEETRTRSVRVDGEVVEKEYTVKVPYVETVQQTYTVQVPYTEVVEQAYTVAVPSTKVVEQSYVATVPGKPQKLTIPVADFSGWDSSGKKVDPNVLAERLSRPTAAFLLRRPLPGNSLKIDPTHLAVLRKDVLFLYSPTIVAKQENRDPQAPVVP